MVELTSEHVSASNRRFGVRLPDGFEVECVLYRGDSLCISTQVGCAVGCGFCASGAQGFGRNLSHAEMLGQLEGVLARGHAVRRATLSGIGEPLHNLSNVEAFMQSCRALGVAPSLTTSGGPVARLGHALRLPHNGLTLSVHAGTEAVRARLVPHAPSLGALFDCLRAVLPSLTQRRRRKTALSYLLLAGENDCDDELSAFVERATPLGLPVHLFAFNPVATNEHRRVTEERYREIYARLLAAGLRVRMSSQARIEQNGGCGTLLAVRTRGDVRDARDAAGVLQPHSAIAVELAR